jgi:CsoR family transcriptional regulator, copper-sensing transcriptional repressor
VAVRDAELKQSIVNRLKSIEGHIRGIQRMVEEDQYCVDILNQTSAISKALEKVDVMILENHLQTCVTTAIRSEDPRERERVIRELMNLFPGGTASPVGRKLRIDDLESLTAGDGRRCCP